MAKESKNMQESKNLQERLLELGDALKSPPSSFDELYSLLDVTDGLLTRVDQSPSQLTLDALAPLMKALVMKDFLRHSAMDVKVSVASCISEITRITAPEAPYEDDIMKEIFQMIVGAFEGLDDMSSRSYQKRVSILETVAKVRSCVVMLDLECDALILQMFQHFLKTIRVDHSENVFSSMETIMTLVIEESEDISTDLLSCLLDTMKKDDKDVLPIAVKLAEKVMTCCASKIKPYLLEFIQSTGASLSEYSKVVASICQENSDDLDHSETLAFGEAVADDSKLSERTVSDELPQVSAKAEQEVGCPEEVATVAGSSPTAATSNDNVQMRNGDSMDQPSSPKHKRERSRHIVQSKSVAPDQTDSVNLETVDLKPDGTLDLRKGKGRRTNSSVQSTDTAEQIDNDKDAPVVIRRKGRSKEADGSEVDNAPVKVDGLVVPLPPEKNEFQRLRGSDNTTPDILPAPIETPPNPSRTKRGRPPGPRAAAKRSDVDAVAGPPASASVHKDSSEDNQVHEKAVPSKGGDYEKEPEDVEAPTCLASDSDVKEKKNTRKKGRYKRGKAAEEETSGRRLKSNAKQQKEEGIHGKDVDGEPTLMEMASSPRSSSKAPKADEAHLGDSVKPMSRRKRALETEEELDERLVGSMIKVWWPKDKMFYEGVVESYNCLTKKHTIVYTDGDVEHLLLKNERWESVENDLDKGTEGAVVSASQMPQAKKVKAGSPSKMGLNTSKHVKSQQQSKSGAESSSKDVRRSRGRPRSGTSNHEKLSYDSTGTMKKSKDKTASDDKVKTPRSSGRLTDGHENEPEEEAPKSSSKQEEPRNKYSRKSKDEPSKSNSKSKNDAPKAGAQLKDDTSKGGSKLGDDFDKLKDSAPKTASGSEADEVGKNKTPRTKPTTNSSSKTGGDSTPNGIPSKRKAKVGDNEMTATASDGEATTGGTGGRKRKRKGRK